MQLTAQLAFANPCDDEEDNLATVGCHSDKGQLFIISRYPDEDSVDLMFDEEGATVRDLKVTLSATRLLVELAAGSTDLFEDDVLEIRLDNAIIDADEVEQTLRVILDGTGTFISER
ncbi:MULTISPECIES: hypothetical protein [Pseudomonas]|uniref:hypothetical protein n=1 Tax=Pseudomonas TaxID=286 RepID=UPI000DA6BD7D|nr:MULTISPECIES: hypothetical protein [Pseudomonas]